MNPDASPPEPPLLSRLRACDTLADTIAYSSLVFEELVGRGSFGRVHRGKLLLKANNKPLEVAIKSLHKPDAEGIRSFRKETRIMRNLHHPNIVQFLGITHHEGRFYLVSEFIEGGTLRALVERNQTLDDMGWADRMRLINNIAAALTYLHQHNILHRDLKTENILVTKNLVAKVTDFGLSRVYDGTSPMTMTIVGTPFSMSPEQIATGRYDGKADTYAFGICMLELMTGRSSDPDVMPRRMPDFAIDFPQVEPLIYEGCPASLLELARRCCEANPEDRPTFSEIRERMATVANEIVSS